MTYKKIAEIVGCSTSTVSKALNGSHEISEEIAKKINDVAIEIGYFKEKSKQVFKISQDFLITQSGQTVSGPSASLSVSALPSPEQ